MTEFGQYLKPVLMFITDQQETMIRLLFQQCKWTYKSEVLTVRQLEILRSLRERPVDSDSVVSLANQDSTVNTEIISKMECEEDENSATKISESALNETEDVPVVMDKSDDVVESIDRTTTELDKGNQEITVMADVRNEAKNDFTDHVVIKTEIPENYPEITEEDFHGLSKAFSVPSADGLCTSNSNVDSCIDLSDEYKAVSNAHSTALDTTYLQDDRGRVAPKLLMDGIINGLSNNTNDTSNFEINFGDSLLDDSVSASASLRSLANSLCKEPVKDTAQFDAVLNSHIQMNKSPKAPRITKTKIKKRKSSDLQKEALKTDNYYHDPVIEQFMNHLQSDKVTRPIVTGLMLRSCCMFLLEKDQGYAEWCKKSVQEVTESQKLTDWKSVVLDIAYESKQLLLEVTIKRLKEIVEASMNRKFVDYLLKFLITAKNLTLDNNSEVKLTYKDVIDNLKMNLIEEPSIVCLSDEDLTYMNTPDDKLIVSEVEEDNAEIVTCKYCKKKLQRKSLRCHISKKHPEYRDGHQCYTCSAMFPTYLDLVEHRKQTRHKVLFPEECPICGKTLSNDLALMEHLRNVHKKETTTNCEICQKESKGRLKVCKHIENYTDSEPYPCDICGQMYPTKRYMVAHRKRHSETARKFKCEECGKAFIMMSLLKAHARTHTGEKPFKCPYCDYRCASSNNLPKHIRIHERKGK